MFSNKLLHVLTLFLIPTAGNSATLLNGYADFAKVDEAPKASVYAACEKVYYPDDYIEKVCSYFYADCKKLQSEKYDNDTIESRGIEALTQSFISVLEIPEKSLGITKRIGTSVGDAIVGPLRDLLDNRKDSEDIICSTWVGQKKINEYIPPVESSIVKVPITQIEPDDNANYQANHRSEPIVFCGQSNLTLKGLHDVTFIENLDSAAETKCRSLKVKCHKVSAGLFEGKNIAALFHWQNRSLDIYEINWNYHDSYQMPYRYDSYYQTCTHYEYNGTSRK